MRRLLRYGGSLALALALAGPAVSQTVLVPRQRPMVRPAPRRPALMDLLGLTPLQRRQLNQMRRSRRDPLAQVNNKIKELRRELADMYRFYPLDEAKASLFIQQITQAEGERLSLQLQNQLDLRRILTPQQFIRFSQLTQTSRRPAPAPPGAQPGL